MTHTADTICDLLDAGKINATQAIRMIQAIGASEYCATESVFIHLGGDDIVEQREDGKEYYARSGKSVEEVEAAMNGPEPSP